MAIWSSHISSFRLTAISLQPRHDSFSRAAKPGSAYRHASPGSSIVRSPCGDFSSDGPCVYSHWPVMRKAHGERDSAVRIRTEPNRQSTWDRPDVSFQLSLDPSGSLVWNLL